MTLLNFHYCHNYFNGCNFIFALFVILLILVAVFSFVDFVFSPCQNEYKSIIKEECQHQPIRQVPYIHEVDIKTIMNHSEIFFNKESKSGLWEITATIYQLGQQLKR